MKKLQDRDQEVKFLENFWIYETVGSSRQYRSTTEQREASQDHSPRSFLHVSQKDIFTFLHFIQYFHWNFYNCKFMLYFKKWGQGGNSSVLLLLLIIHKRCQNHSWGRIIHQSWILKYFAKWREWVGTGIKFEMQSWRHKTQTKAHTCTFLQPRSPSHVHCSETNFICVSVGVNGWWGRARLWGPSSAAPCLVWRCLACVAPPR